MKKFLDWLVDTYLSDWIVSREDYKHVQLARIGAESYVTRLISELDQVYSELYKRKFETYEQFGEKVETKFIKTERVDIQEFQFNYHFRIPHAVFYTLRNPTQHFRETEEVIIAKLTKAFEAHMQRNLFHAL